MLATEHETFIAFANQMQDTAGKALDAVEKRDPAALFKAGSEMNEVCESCHHTSRYHNPK